MTQSLDLNKMSLMPMSEFEIIFTEGGDGMFMPMGTGGSNPSDAGKMLIKAAAIVGHEVGDFFRGFWNGL